MQDDQLNPAAEAPIEEVDTYYSMPKAIRVASWAQTLSVVALLVALATGGLTFWFNWDQLQNSASIEFRQILALLLGALDPVVDGFVIFVVLQAIALLIYLFMDIEANGRPESG